MRINLYEEFLPDPRFKKLCNRLPRRVAIGALVELWEIGMSYWKKSGGPPQLIPFDVGDHLDDMEHLIACGFARREDDGYYCAGARDRWQFLRSKIDAGRKGGEKSVESRRDKDGSALPVNAPNRPKQTEAPPKQRRSRTEAGPSKPKPSSSSSGSGSLDLLNTRDLTSPPGGPRPPTAADLIALFCDEWKGRYPGAEFPPITGKAAGQLKRLGADLGWERASKLIRAYFQMPNRHYVQRAHSVDVLVMATAEIQQFINTGRIVTKRFGDELEQKVDCHQGTGVASFSEAAEAVLARERNQIKGDQ